MTKKRILAAVLTGALAVGLLAGCGSTSGGGGDSKGGDSSSSASKTIKIGYVNPTTGALAGNGEGCEWVVKQITDYVNANPITVDGEEANIEVIVYDSASDQNTCAEMAQKLVEEDNVDLMVAIQTPETVIPVASVAERYEVPCIAIQAPVDPVAHSAEQFDWTFHAFWTIEKVYQCHKALWTAAGCGPETGATVGLLFANDADGTAWHDYFVKQLAEDGYNVVDPGQYPSGTNDFSTVAAALKKGNINVLAGTNIPPDFMNAFNAVIGAGVQVDCITMGKCCLLAGDVEALGDLAEGIMTEVWWVPTNPFVSDLTGVSCEELGAKYQEDNGRTMPQPAGYAYAALELAVEAFKAAGTTDKAAVRDAIGALDTTTIVGPIKYDQKMAGLTYSDTVIGGGQWQRDENGDLVLKVIDNTVYDVVPLTGEYVPGNATQK